MTPAGSACLQQKMLCISATSWHLGTCQNLLFTIYQTLCETVVLKVGSCLPEKTEIDKRDQRHQRDEMPTAFTSDDDRPSPVAEPIEQG